MKKNEFNFDYVWAFVSFIWFGLGSAFILYLALSSNLEAVKEISDNPPMVLLFFWAISPFGLAGRIRRYWSIYVKEDIPKFFPKLFLLESFLMYGNFIFCGFLIFPLKMNLHIPYLYLKILAMALTVPLIVLIFFDQKKRHKQVEIK
jgi:hypothetical protein